MQNTDFLSAQQAAEFLNISLSTLNRRCMEGDIAYYRPKRKRYFKKDDLVDYIESGRKEAI